MEALHIHGASAYLGQAHRDMALLKEEVRRHTPENFRRSNRFILLSLLGARQCVGRQVLAKDTAVYLATERGNLSETVTVLDEIYASHSLPKPFGFINTMSGTAAFYLAQNLGIQGRSIILSSRRTGFERGLELLRTDFALGVEASALIGGVDEVSPEEEELGKRRGWTAVDGSGWLYLRTERQGACGMIRENRTFADGRSLVQWLKERQGSPADVAAFGVGIGAADAAALRDALGPAALFNTLQECGYSGSATACAIALFVRRFPGRTLWHLNQDDRGRYTLIEVQVY